MAETSEPFDLEAVYDQEISPLMEQIIAICKREKMPVLASFLYAVKPDPDEGGEPIEHLCTTVLLWDERPCRTLNITSQIVRRGLGEGETLRVLPGVMAMTITHDGAPG